MLKFIYGIVLILGLFWPLTALAVVPVTQQEDPDLMAVFERACVYGTFVLYDPWENKLVCHNRQRADERFVPASTFKIYNSLVAMHYGLINDVDEIFYHWDGTPQEFGVWEKDMSLGEAIRVSNVTAYRQLARQVGLDRMQKILLEQPYGNMQIGNAVDDFWLDGSLKISAREQAIFLADLNMDWQIWSREHLELLRNITLFAQDGNKSLHAKTGTSTRFGLALCWWVGWVRDNASGRVWSFALNIDMPDYPNGPDRPALGLECLQTLGIWP